MRSNIGSGIVSTANSNQKNLVSLKAGQYADMKDIKRIVIDKRQTLTFSPHNDSVYGKSYSGTIRVIFKTRSGLTPMATCGYKVNNDGIEPQPHPSQDIQDRYQGTYIQGGGATAIEGGVRWTFAYDNQGLTPDPSFSVVAITDKLDITFQIISNMAGVVEVENVSD